MPVIEIDEEVFAAIQAEAVPIVDTANDVLRRKYRLAAKPPPDALAIVSKPTGEGRSPVRKRRIAGRDDRTPQSSYGLPLLQALVDLGGGGYADVVQEHVFTRVQDQLTEVDLQQLDSGEYRWRKDIQWMRMKLADRGFISRAKRGYWDITDAGREAVRSGQL